MSLYLGTTASIFAYVDLVYIRRCLIIVIVTVILVGLMTDRQKDRQGKVTIITNGKQETINNNIT